MTQHILLQNHHGAHKRVPFNTVSTQFIQLHFLILKFILSFSYASLSLPLRILNTTLEIFLVSPPSPPSYWLNYANNLTFGKY